MPETQTKQLSFCPGIQTYLTLGSAPYLPLFFDRNALRQELIQQLQALGFMPSAYSCESATPSRQTHRDLRVSADAVAVSNDLHSCSRPQAILKVRHLRSLDYRPCQRSCLKII